jgi:TolA-binding protein
MKMTAPALAGLLLGALLPAAAGQRNPDLLRYKAENDRIRSTKVKVLEYGYLTLKYQKDERDPKELPISRVLTVRLGGFPPAYQQGMAAEKQAGTVAGNLLENLEKAANSYALAAGEEGLRQPLKAAALYRSAICTLKLALAESSWIDRAVTRFREYLQAYPKHHEALQAILHLGKLLRLKGSPDEALTELKKIDQKVLDENIPVIWEVRSKLEQVKAHFRAGRIQQARTTVANANTLLAEITGQQELVKSLQSRNDLLKGRCDIKAKAYDAAIRYFEGIINAAGTDLTRKVVGLVGKGEAFYHKGREKGDMGALRKAQLAFARASVLNPNMKEFGAKAAFFTGEVLTALAGKGEGARYAQQAKDYYREVIRYYPLSDWSAAARKRLAE